jgi:predicted transcriptional regulator
MPSLTIEVPDVIARRLDALATVSSKSVNQLALEALDSFAGSVKSRRAILKAWRNAAQIAGTSFSLSDLGWINGYSGQSVDELLLFEGTEGVRRILITLQEAVQAKVKAAGPLNMTGVERMLLSLMALSMEVENGGFKQFFFNSSRQFAPSIVGDLVRIGCTEIADIAQRALDALDLPQLSGPAIEAAIKTENQGRDRALKRCDIEFYARTELPERLFAYVKAHQDGICI